MPGPSWRYGDLILVAGSGHPQLAEEIAECLGVPLLPREIIVFPNENISFGCAADRM
ncbi:hypothetical protein [Thermoflexus sp.]|uniref:hypothetical protein n=1 Tax=Thermoflexus sp. TaxID=1969742 RepID=UPI0035E42937